MTTVKLLEYGDYECPNCLEAYPIVKQLQKTFKHNLSFDFKNFPITESHPHAFHAACAAESAKLQGKFWPMHNMLFEHQSNLDDSSLLSYASALGLDLEKFTTDMNSQKIFAIVHKDILEGAKKGVNGTPTFFINGKRHDEDHTYAQLKSAITARL